MIVLRHPAVARALVGVLVLAGLVTGCSTVPDRSAAADAITDRLRALPGVLAVDGQYANGMVEGVSYHVDIRMDGRSDLPQLLATVDTFYDGLAGADFAGHTSRYMVRRGDDLIQVFGDDRYRERPTDDVRRWVELTDQVPGALRWAVGPDPATDIRSISVDLPDDVALSDAMAALAARAPDLADRRWIIRWHQLRLDLMGAPYPPRRVIATVEPLVADGDWSVTYDPAADPALEMAVWAPNPERMEDTARAHLPAVVALHIPVRYTVRGTMTDPAEVLVGGCLRTGSQLQQRLNAEFGGC